MNMMKLLDEEDEVHGKGEMKMVNLWVFFQKPFTFLTWGSKLLFWLNVGTKVTIKPSIKYYVKKEITYLK